MSWCTHLFQVLFKMNQQFQQKSDILEKLNTVV